MNSEWQDFFDLNKNEQRGIIALSTILFIIIILNHIIPEKENIVEYDYNDFKTLVSDYQKSIIKKNHQTEKAYIANTYDKESKFKKTNHSPFDPNTLNKEGWLELGLSEKQINSISNYLNSGAKFKVAEDIRKLYCLNKEECNALIPLIKIEKDSSVRVEETNNKHYINLNNTTIEELIQIKGIGYASAKSIIKYRELLGGYYDVNQIQEAYLIDSTLFASIKDYFYTDSTYYKININKANYYQLSIHPYISKSLAFSIIEHKEINGKFKDLECVKNISLINDSIYNKIYLYFAVTDE